ncbi:hypothetical protein [Flavivirga sp. 57AJ16]|uniref:hypothetical protein n=1 Tax=Flavivirga sp. 57AJ16 TaxID=3025307 RepID=UPI0023657C0F|nr:hypothetical protein [Flavivirga sp. 57AJ16]
MIFSDIENTWKQLSNTYHTTFKSLVYGAFPTEEDILKTLQKIKNRIAPINWENIGL